MKCSVCSHPRRVEIDAAIAAKEPQRSIAARFGVSKTALHRHAHEAQERNPHGEGPVRLRLVRNGPTSSPPSNKSRKKAPPRTSPGAIVAADQESKIVALRLSGKTYREIADELGVAPSTACRIVDRVLRQRRAELGENIDAARQLELERLDVLFSSHWGRAIDPAMQVVDVPADNEAGVRAYDAQDKATDRVIRISERRAKILGLDAPTQIHAVDVILASPVNAQIWQAVGAALEDFPEARAAVVESVNRVRAHVGTKLPALAPSSPVVRELGLGRSAELVDAEARARRGDETALRDVERFALTGFVPGDPRFDVERFIDHLVDLVPELAGRKIPELADAARRAGRDETDSALTAEGELDVTT